MTSSNVLFEDVLDALKLEESRPSYAALLRWSERYPQYREALAEFFATWAIQAEQPQQVALDEERLADRGVSHALKILRRQDRVSPAGAIEPVAPFDQLVLTAIYLLRGEGYSVNITDKVGEMSGTSVMLASTFASLDRLESRGLISSLVADETEPEGRTRRYFTVTFAGERALAQAKETSKLLADFLGDLA
jgi:hypothetical protein